jgi:hypothetical protein
MKNEGNLSCLNGGAIFLSLLSNLAYGKYFLSSSTPFFKMLFMSFEISK